MDEKTSEGAESALHWADAVAASVAATGRPAVVSTGISPSGEIHIGNMREVLTGDAIFRALRDRSWPARFNYVADNFDPLRHVYPFLDATRYGPLVGRPLCEIPCPCDGHASYAEHFLEPFLAALGELRVEVEVERADLMYKSGRMNRYIVAALRARDTIARILQEETGKQVEPDWSPFNPLCPACGRLTRTRVSGFSAEDESVDFACECGKHSTVALAGGGKLNWRIDWPARWMLLGVTVEPFGKDHATRGGSYDTGIRLAREVFGGEPPLGVPYEWIRLKGGGDMSSSRGNVLSIARMLEVAPPEALRYLVIRERPQRSIAFDPGLPLLQLVDEIDDAAASDRDERAAALSLAGAFRPVGVPYKHLVVVAQAARFDPTRALEILRRTGYPEAAPEEVRRRLPFARRWLEAFAPAELRFDVQVALPAAVAELSPEQRIFLGRLADRLDATMDGAAIHARIYELAGEFTGTPPAELFRAIYLALLGKARGPRAGSFIEVLGVDFVAQRLRLASRSS
jgi:lysyl-tRNA synthetase class 1